MKHPQSSRRFFLCLLPWISVFFSGGRFLVAQTPPACQQTKLFLSDGQHDDLAGTAVDLNNDFLFVGKPPLLDTPNVSTAGVYIFRPGLTPNTWVEVQVFLDPLDTGQSSTFGFRLDVSNDCLIVLAPTDDGATGSSGAAYIFRFDVVANAWAFEQKIFASDGGFSDGFGGVSISFDLAIIGSDSHTHGGIKTGAAHIFRFDGTSWNEEAELLANDRASGDSFGISVALVGNVAIAGASLDDDLGAGSGSVYVFKKMAGSWIQTGKITAPDGAAGDRLGWSVDFDGTTLAIGAIYHDYGEPDLGAVYLFQDNGLPGWEFITKLTPPPNGDGRNDDFGNSVDIDGDRLAIGTIGSGNRGSAHVYRDSGTGWEHILRLVAQDSSFGEGFGQSIAIHNQTVAIGARWDDQIGVDAGAVYTHTNIFTPDCNANCISDTEELAAGTAFDCNANGILDECDLTDGVSLDCNNNGIPDECEDCDNNGIADECELAGQFTVDSPQLSPISLGFPVSHTFTAPPEAQGDVTMRFAAIADLDSTVLALDVYLNDVFQGRIFRLTGSRCPATPDEDQLVVAMADFNTLVGSGDAVIRIETFDSVEFDVCAGTSWVSVSLEYLAPPVVPDVNGNGVPDSCDLARGDFNLDGVVNVTDLLSLLGAWGVCPGCVEDTNLDGIVNVTDLLTLLANWG